MSWIVGIDIGGSFTDLVAYNIETGEVRRSKVLTTYPDLSEGVINAVREAGINIIDILAVIHGTTIVINTIIERRGAKTALLTTRGFRDVIEIGRGNRPDMYNLHYKKPDPIVPRKLRFEITERIRSDGAIILPLNVDEVIKAAERLKAESIEAIAISYINSYANPEHEEITANIVKKILPKAFISTSSKVTREYREYERTITAVLNAYVGPRTSSYIRRLRDIFEEKLLLLQSASGVISADDAEKVPIKLIESGPVAGVIGAMSLAKLTGYDNVITIDGGSTTTKSSIIYRGLPSFKSLYHVGGYISGWPVLVPTIDISEVGVAGNSIIWIDEMGRVRIGPQSAGSVPGPVCYGLGGKEPTITDVMLLMGRLNPSYYLGGRLKLNIEPTRKALDMFFDKIGMQRDEGLIKLTELTAVLMASAIKNISIERGHDPREFVLIAFGGSGPLFASPIARNVGISRIIIPPYPAYFSAMGMLVADIRYDYVQTVVKPLRDTDIKHIEKIYTELSEDGISKLNRMGIKEYLIIKYADMRYRGQEHTLTIQIPGEYTPEDLREIFHKRHRETYGYELRDYEIEIVNLRVAIIGITKKPEILKEIRQCGKEPPSISYKGTREVLFEGKGWLDVPVFERENLCGGNMIQGPAIIEEPTSTTVLYEGDSAEIDMYGNIVIKIEK